MNEINFEVKGSSIDPYIVVFLIEMGRFLQNVLVLLE